MKLREQEGWSQTEMAGRFGVTPSAYHKNEKGENTPCIETLHRLWGKLGISMNWLFFDDGPKYRKRKDGTGKFDSLTTSRRLNIQTM